MKGKRQIEAPVQVLFYLTLTEHLRDYSHWHHDMVDRIAEQMGGSTNAEACAREAVRGMAFEERQPYE